jgi:hypothetical protein
MIRLLVTSMTVITSTLMIVDEWYGLGQFGVAFRKNPYATRHAANVMMSEMMNSHIASLIAGIANGDGSIAGA